MQKAIVTALLITTTGCATAQNPAIRIEDHSISSGWQQSPTGVWERVLVPDNSAPRQPPAPVVDPHALPYAIATPGMAPAPAQVRPAPAVEPVQVLPAPAPVAAPAVRYYQPRQAAPTPAPAPIARSVLPAPSRPTPAHQQTAPVQRAVPVTAAAPAPQPAKLQSRERELTLRYANGDKDAAVELARLLYSQGRVSTADTVLDFAVRHQHPMALQLKAERQRLQGG